MAVAMGEDKGHNGRDRAEPGKGQGERGLTSLEHEPHVRPSDKSLTYSISSNVYRSSAGKQHCPHFTDEETVAQRDYKQLVGLTFEGRPK